jgi:hypothetical protein
MTSMRSTLTAVLRWTWSCIRNEWCDIWDWLCLDDRWGE